MNNPLVSVITPTIRPDRLTRCIELFKAQDYPNKEQIIIEGDGSIGYKRNRGVAASKGEIILHMDDDDFYSPHYISKSVKFLLDNNLDITGLNNCYFYDELYNRGYEWKYADPTNAMPYVCEATMCYRKSVWERRQFRDINSGEGIYFLSHLPNIKAHNHKESFVAYLHGNNTASRVQVQTFHRIDVDIVTNIVNSHKY